MIQIKNKVAIRKMKQAGAILSNMFTELTAVIQPGVTTGYINDWIENHLKKHGLVSRMKGYMGYAHVSCLSLNDVVVHGVPTFEQVCRDGDLLKVDVCASYKGYCADMARPFFIGTVTPEVHALTDAAERSLYAGIQQMVPGNRLGAVSAAIGAEIERSGYGIVREFAGHGIGKQMHEDPEVLNYGKAQEGPILRSGMACALEPMITAGNHEVYIADDGWTVYTRDKSLAAHVEDTVVVTDHGPLVITRTS